jgi:uncharacterized membrane protein YdcZ (DUF606 family)
MTDSVVRIVVGTLMLAGATAGAAGAPQPSAIAERLSASLTDPVYAVSLAAAVGLLCLVAVKLRVSAPGYAGKHRA